MGGQVSTGDTMETGDTSDPSRFFGSATYFEGHHRLGATGYSYENALIIKHEQTGIRMWACAFDLREDSEHKGLRDGDKVLYHYTDEASFFPITSLEGARIWANPDVNNTDSFFGLGVYATEKAPHQWRSKDEVRLNNFYPTRQNFRTWSGQELPEAEDADFEALLKGTVGNYVKQHYPGKTDYCIPLIVDQQVSKNAMKEVTDGPLMRNRSFHLDP